MLINAQGIAHDDPEVIETTFLCTDWLIRQGYLMDYPSQQSGIYKFTPSGIDLVDLTLEENKTISDLYLFLQNLDGLEEYEIKPIHILGLFVRQMEKSGNTNETTMITLNNRIALGLSRLYRRKITLQSIQTAANVCKSRKYLSQRYVSSGPYEQMNITDFGLNYYDQNAEEDMIPKGEPQAQSAEISPQVDPQSNHGIYINANDDNAEIIKTNLGVQTALVYSASQLIEPLEDFRESIRCDNQLPIDHPELKEELLDLLDRLLIQMRFLIGKMPLDVGEEHEDELEETISWAKDTYTKTLTEFSEYFSPDSVSKIIAPTAITLGLGVIGSLFGGGAGFAAGTLIGNVVTRNAKPKDLSDKLNGQLNTTANRPSDTHT